MNPTEDKQEKLSFGGWALLLLSGYQLLGYLVGPIIMGERP
jgi:hypothetical protein